MILSSIYCLAFLWKLPANRWITVHESYLIFHPQEIMRMQLAVEEADVAAAIADDVNDGEDEHEHSSSSQTKVLNTNSYLESDEKLQQRTNQFQEDIIKKKV